MVRALILAVLDGIFAFIILSALLVDSLLPTSSKVQVSTPSKVLLAASIRILLVSCSLLSFHPNSSILCFSLPKWKNSKGILKRFTTP